jgi:drug/metabolite transporter (DMT)-like permease
MSRNSLGALMMCLSMFGFAVMDSISKFMVQSHPVAQTLWVRYVIYALFALLIARPKGIRAMFRAKRPRLQVWRSLLALVENAVFFWAFAYLPLAETHAIGATSPLIVIVMAAPLLGEKVGLHRWLAVLIGFVGVLLIVRPGFAEVSWPLALPVAGALMWGAYQIMLRMSAREDSPETTLLWSAFVGLAAISLVAPFQWEAAGAFEWILLLAIGVLGSLCHYGLIRALDYAHASAMQPYSYTLLVWAAIMGFLVFGDIPAVWTFVGGALVVLGGLYSWHRDRLEVMARPAPPRAVRPPSADL